MNIDEINIQIEEEIKNNKTNAQFLMIKDIYCAEGLNLEPDLACFYSFLIFISERFMHNNKGIKPYIGYSDKSLTEMYSLKWFKVCERKLQKHLQELKNKELIIIKNEGKASRKIYINYAKIQPELLNLINDTIEDEYKIKIESLKKENEVLKKQNELLLNQVTKTKETTMGMFVKILFDKKYLSEKDNLTNNQLEDYNAMLKSFLFSYQKENLDFLKSLNYICENANTKTIGDKFSYLCFSLNNYLNKIKGIPPELWDEE